MIRSDLIGARVYWNDAPLHSPSYEVYGTVTAVSEHDLMTIRTDDGREVYQYPHSIIVYSLREGERK